MKCPPGCLILLISLFGCCGASRENKYILHTYGALIIILLIAQVN